MVFSKMFQLRETLQDVNNPGLKRATFDESRSFFHLFSQKLLIRNNNMNFLKISLAIVIGALSTGATLSIATYFLSLNRSSSGGGNFISFSNPENLIAIVGAILGVIIGGISSAVIVGFQLNFLKAILFGFIFNFLLGIALLIITQEPWTNNTVFT